jgi:hypothetical protein
MALFVGHIMLEIFLGLGFKQTFGTEETVLPRGHSQKEKLD